MSTKNEYGLGPLYHATPAQNTNTILANGLTRLPVWLAYEKEDAYRSAIDHMEYAGSVTVFVVNLPGDWELEKASHGEYLSHKPIPRRFIRRITK